MPDTIILALNHTSPEFDAAYDVISTHIGPEYLETREFLKTRLAARDSGLKTEQEKILIPDGYTLHLLAAMNKHQVIGAIYGHLISKITSENRSVGFITYVAVERSHQHQGIATTLIRELKKAVDEDSIRRTGEHIFGMVYEIEEKGKKEIKSVVKKLGARPLDIVYYQPALRMGYKPERMDLWFQPIPQLSQEEALDFSLRADVVTSLVRNMLSMEYVGPETKGFDLESKPYKAFLASLEGKKTVNFTM